MASKKMVGIKTENTKGIASSMFTFHLEGDDIDNYFRELELLIRQHLTNERKKIKLVIETDMYLPLPLDSRSYIKAYFSRKPTTTFSLNQLSSRLNEIKAYFKAWVDMFQTRGSGFVFDKITKTDLHIFDLKPLVASSYFKLPFYSSSIVNIQNKDDKCFLWSVLAHLHPVKIHPERVSNYKPYENEINMKGIDYPFKINNLRKFEKQNPDIGINILGIDLNLEETNKKGDIIHRKIETIKKNLFPKEPTLNTERKHIIDLLYVNQNNGNSHYCLIKNLPGLLNATKIKNYLCRRCLYGKTSQQALDNHEKDCEKESAARLDIPKP